MWKHQIDLKQHLHFFYNHKQIFCTFLNLNKYQYKFNKINYNGLLTYFALLI
jgi:hypothetical protein